MIMARGQAQQDEDDNRLDPLGIVYINIYSHKYNNYALYVLIVYFTIDINRILYLVIYKLIEKYL